MDVVQSMQARANSRAFIVITTFNYFMWVTTSLTCCGLIQTMLTWYELYRSDGLRPARKIKVGIPDNARSQEPDEDGSNIDLGHVIPEADREVSQVPSAFIRDLKIAADYETTPRELKADTKYSQPSILLEANTLKTLDSKKRKRIARKFKLS